MTVPGAMPEVVREIRRRIAPAILMMSPKRVSQLPSVQAYDSRPRSAVLMELYEAHSRWMPQSVSETMRMACELFVCRYSLRACPQRHLSSVV